jgi:hypothetical protein
MSKKAAAKGVATKRTSAPKSKPGKSARRDGKGSKPTVRSDHSAAKATQIADVLRGTAHIGMPGWLNGEAAYAWFISNGVVRQIIGRFAMLMTKPDHKYTHSDVRDFDWAPTTSQLDDLKFKFACRMAATWAFVFGAGIIEHVVDDADRATAGDPLELDKVRAYKGVRVHTAYSLRPENGTDWKTAEWFETQRVTKRRWIHRSRLSIMVANDTPDGIVMPSISGWPPSWMEGIYQSFTEWSNVECDVSAIIRTLSILHLQLHDWALAAENPDSDQAAAVDARMAQALETLSAHGILITDKKDALGEVSRNVSGLDKLIESKALRASASAGVPKELIRMEAEGNLGDNSAPIDAYYDLVGGWAEQMVVPATTDASEISLAAQRYKAQLARETLIVPSQFIVKQDPIQQANGKEKAEQRKSNADARVADFKWGLPADVIMQDPELRENYTDLDAYLEAQTTREQLAKEKAVEAGLDNPEGEDMISAAQAARPFNISPATLIKMAKAGKVPGRVIVGRWKFYLSQVQTALMGKTTAQLEAAADERLDDIGLSESTTFGESWGESDAMREIFAVLERIRDSRLSVLLLGETGTGKEAIARGLHVGDGPFVAINAAELAEDAGTAAKQLRAALVAATGGTLFLDEVGDTPRESQSALLRILASEHKARIVSATSRPAEWLRPDLYYRLAEVEIEIPPLRDRESDVVEIAKRIYAKYTSERGYEAADPEFTDAAIATMMLYPWPGNIRELKSAVSRGVELAPRATPVGVEHMQLNIRGEH